jgi:predicted O-methyltransferase YrrM
VNLFISTSIAGLLGLLIALRADLRRRGLSLTRGSGWHFLSVLDIACPTITVGIACGLIPVASWHGSVQLYSPVTWAIAACVSIVAYIWSEGRRQIQVQRPAGIVFAEWLILAGASGVVESVVFRGAPGVPNGSSAMVACVVAILGGAGVIAIIVPRFLKRSEAHHILDRIAEQGESVQTEYMPPTPECPHPELWKMADSQTSEIEVLEFLNSVVRTIKPQLIVETGTFIGYSAIKMAEGLKANGSGRIITIEYDPAIFAKAKKRIDASGLGNWIEYRNESSLETRIEGTIDLLFSDSHSPIREQEIRRFLPQIDPRGLILVHDASSHFKIVREAALRLEQEGLISVVLLSTPRGLVVAQKRAGRK